MKNYVFIFLFIFIHIFLIAQQTQKPPLHGLKYMAITGKPIGATAGAKIFEQGGNAVDAACAMIAASCTIWDVLSWGGETQALIYNPKTNKVIGINALGVAPTGATVSYFKNKGYNFPPEYGPEAAITPGTFGGICLMLANYGTMHLYQVLQPSLELAKGYPIEAQTANAIEKNKNIIKQWKYSKAILLPHLGESREAPEAGEIFVQKELANTLQQLIDVEKEAISQGKSRTDAIYAAYNLFYKGAIADEIVRSVQEQGGLFTKKDLANWHPTIEEPLHTNYKGIEVYKLKEWTQGPMLLQALNILENIDLKTLKYNSPEYINTIYQTMSLSFADRDFYYGDPTFSNIPIQGLLNKDYAKKRASLINPTQNNINIAPGDPYPFQNQTNPYSALLLNRSIFLDTILKSNNQVTPKHDATALLMQQLFNEDELYKQRLMAGTTTVEAADADGWVVSVTPSGGWIPACIAGNTGIGLSQRLQSFVLDSIINPHNVLQPNKQPRVTLTPTLALKNNKPIYCFGVQGGDTQDQNLLQFFINMVEFNMTVQQATEAANINTNQLILSLGGVNFKDRLAKNGQIILSNTTPKEVQNKLKEMGYIIQLGNRTSGPINAIFLDEKHKSIWGGSSNNGEDYGICW